jgi:hypothetical protein
VFLRLNLLLLFVSILPFPTGMIGAYLHDTDAERIAVTVYGVNLLAIRRRSASCGDTPSRRA